MTTATTLAQLLPVAALLVVTTAFPAKPADEAAAWGDVEGRVVWDGKIVPEPEVLVVDKDKAHCLEKGPIRAENWVINRDNKGVRWVFVWLAPADAAIRKLPVHPSLTKIAEREVAIDQPCCAFVPHALAVREGQDLLVKNGSPVAHTVRWAGHPMLNPPGDVLTPPRGEYRLKGLRADPTPILFSCSIHFWMKAYIRVFDHPYYGVTDADGRFAIPRAPAGPVRLVVWHERAGYRGGAAGRTGEKIAVKPGANTDLGDLPIKE